MYLGIKIHTPVYLRFACIDVYMGTSQVVLMEKNLLANARDLRDAGSIPGLGRSPGEGLGNPPQYSCLENPLGRGALWATVHGVTKSQTRLSDLVCTRNVCI